MTRKDTILIAVVINAGLLAILFTTAVIYDTDKTIEQTEFVSPLVENKQSQVEAPSVVVAAASTGDEVDNVLKYYTQPSSQPIAVEPLQDIYVPEPLAVQSNGADHEDLPQVTERGENDHFVEVTVKKGDMLEKIAKANGTTVGAIKRANQLQSERLTIGQVLKIPVKKEVSSLFTNPKPVKRQEEKKEVESGEAVYYVVKNGDNPWKIAKQFNVKFDDIVRLNHLDEEKARNLKVGDRIRVK